MSDRVTPTERSRYRAFIAVSTRWEDNDAYGHVNNAKYYSFFDTAVNQHLIEHGLLDVVRSPVIGLVIETRCTYFAPIGFPDRVTIGLRTERLGTSSATYEIALFRNDESQACAQGRFVHVYVDRSSQRPVPIPAPVRALLQSLGD